MTAVPQDPAAATLAAPQWTECTGDAAFLQAAIARILERAAEAIAARGRFLLVLAGGDTPRAIYENLASHPCDWNRWHLFLSDERCLPEGHPARNETMVRKAWTGRAAIPPDQFVTPKGTDPVAAAMTYAQALDQAGFFDLVLLGLGEDGHTASLFPGHPAGDTAGAPAALPVFGAPKPPPERVTMSARRLCEAEHILFLAKGAGKRDALTAWRAGAPLPATWIRGRGTTEILWSGS